MNTTVILRKDELLSHRDAILSLFAVSYDGSLPEDLWSWAYIDNPNGCPIVVLSHDNNDLIGHYAMIPLPLVRGSQVRNSYLSMTTMVAPSHQGRGVFVELARAAYDVAARHGVECVLGFPNPKSSPGFRKNLGWKLPAPDRIATFEREELISFASHERLFSRDTFGIQITGASREWRLAKPGMSYETTSGLIFKSFADTVDLVWCRHERDLHELPTGRPINVIINSDFALPSGLAASEYQFGGAALAGTFDPTEISRCMLLSDVF